jgi:hypothetical protein
MVESLQSHFILTMSHWSSRLPVCFPSQGTQVQIPRGVLMWNRDSPVSNVSLQYQLKHLFKLFRHSSAFIASKGRPVKTPRYEEILHVISFHPATMIGLVPDINNLLKNAQSSKQCTFFTECTMLSYICSVVVCALRPPMLSPPVHYVFSPGVIIDPCRVEARRRQRPVRATPGHHEPLIGRTW